MSPAQTAIKPIPEEPLPATKSSHVVKSSMDFSYMPNNSALALAQSLTSRVAAAASQQTSAKNTP